MKKRTIIKRILWVVFGIILFIGVCIFPYPALFMVNSIPKQPELSTNEKKYFEGLKKEQSWSNINRTYMNVDSLGKGIMVRNIPIDFLSNYRYSIVFSTEDTLFYFSNNSSKQALQFAKYINDSICLNSINLIEIDLSIRYNNPIDKSGNGDMHGFYQFITARDSIYLVPQKN